MDDMLGSDHLRIVIAVSSLAVIEESSQPHSLHWMYRKADLKGFKNDYKRVRTEDIVTDDVTTSCNHIVSAILQAAAKNVLVFKPSKNPTKKLVSYVLDRRVDSGSQRTKQGEEQDAADT